MPLQVRGEGWEQRVRRNGAGQGAERCVLGGWQVAGMGALHLCCAWIIAPPRPVEHLLLEHHKINFSSSPPWSLLAKLFVNESSRRAGHDAVPHMSPFPKKRPPGNLEKSRS